MILTERRRPESACGGARIGFLSAASPEDRLACSGSVWSMARALERRGNEIVWLGPAPAVSVAAGRSLDFALRRLAGKRYDFRRNPFVFSEYGALFGAAVRRLAPDWILAPFGSAELAGLNSDVPVVYCADATYRLMRDYYGSFRGFVNEADGDRAEALAIEKASLCAYPSSWAAESAVRDYGIDPARVAIIPFGANFEVPEPCALPEKRLGAALHLLFIGVDWERKGGSIAFETLVRLQELGVPASLTVVGCLPPPGFRNHALTVIPFLDKRSEEGRHFLRELYLRTHLLLLPSRAEAFGVVVYEANGYGVPAVVAETGGLADAVSEGVNGFRLPLSARGADFAAAIAALCADPARYARLVCSSRETYERHGSWDAWAAELCRRVAETLPSHERPAAFRG
jgi:glycosyltransferase involved in cell wall biosynthesis